MKKDQQTRKKLTRKECDRMWGGDGPYSQVRLSHEIRILDDRISRIFLVVEAEINPFTFEYVKKRRKYFADDDPIQDLLDHAEYRGVKFGYVTCAGVVESKEKDASDFAEAYAKEAVEEIIRMHEFVMGDLGLKKSRKEFGILDSAPPRKFVWNPETKKVENADGGIWKESTLVGIPAGVKNNKGRMYVVLAFAEEFGCGKETAKEAVKTFVKNLDETAARFSVEIENVENFSGYMLLTVLVPFDVAPADFIEGVIAACRAVEGNPMFKESYLTTNVKRPTPNEIARFLKGQDLKGWKTAGTRDV